MPDRRTSVQFANLRHAIPIAAGNTPSVIGWKPGGWVIYSPLRPRPDGVVPDLLLLRQGAALIPLSEHGIGALLSIAREATP